MNNKIHHNSFFKAVVVYYGWVAWWTSSERAKKLIHAREERKDAKRHDRNLQNHINRAKEEDAKGDDFCSAREILSLCDIVLTVDYQPLYVWEENGILTGESAWASYDSLSNDTALILITAYNLVSNSFEAYQLEFHLQVKVRKLLFKLTPPSDWDIYVLSARTLTNAESHPRLSISEGFSLPIFSRPPPTTGWTQPMIQRLKIG
jgi:hypothetical protein